VTYRIATYTTETNVPKSSVMSDPVLHILLALSDRPRHGYAILQEIEERTDGAVVLGTGTLYTALKRLRAEGLIREMRDPADGSGRKRRTYGLTDRGRTVLAEQTARLQALFEHARQKHALPDPGTA
jgi:DNA-binding PadR family transcriptional regulator